MAPARVSLLGTTALASAAAGTTWVATLAWHTFTVETGRYVWPLLLLGAVVAGTGVLARWWRAPGALVISLQVLVSGMVASVILCGAVLPVGDAWDRFAATMTDSVDSANAYSAPVPPGVPGVHPLLILGGLACLLLVDALACTLRRVPLAGLPLLTIYSVPVSMLGTGISWWIFGLTAGGFLLMLYLHENEQVARWGRALGEGPSLAATGALGVRPGTVRASAGAIGGLATALAVFLPVLIPTFNLQLLDFGSGPGGNGDISITNPMTDMRRDLQRGADIPLLTVRTPDPDPSYLRIAVLNRFSNAEWSSGDRTVPGENVARGKTPPLVGVDASVPRREYPYEISAEDTFRSTWLPTTSEVSSISADGDWRYDPSTMDFIASDDDLDTGGEDWSFTAVRLDRDPDVMARAQSSVGLVDRSYTDLPDGIDPLVRNLAVEVTRDAPSRFEKAVALQDWFRTSGGFTYDPSVDPGNGTDDLVRFLTDGDGGRTGYCEQFASAMAVMARELGIPARVAVGFLTPEKTGADSFVYSAHDLHAWPELFIPGSGWVMFEPTPAGRARVVPSYTRSIGAPVAPTGAPSVRGPDGAATAPQNPKPTVAPAEDTAAGADAAESGSGLPWLWFGSGLVVLILAGAGLLPRTVRSRRREHRLGGGPEDAWLELRDTVLDLGLGWPRDRSPRQTGEVVATWFGAPVDEYTPDRPARGAGLAPDAELALERIVTALELRRYARGRSETGGALRAEVQTCVEALRGGATRGVRRRAEWWPRSVFDRSRPITIATSEREEQVHGRVVDHVG